MWAEFLYRHRRGTTQAHADFEDGVRANAVIDALYASAASGTPDAGRPARRLDAALQGAAS